MNRRHFFKALGVLLAGGVASGAGAISLGRSRNPYYDGPVSDHYDGLQFFNPGGEPPNGLADVLKSRLTQRGKTWPAHSPSPYADVPPRGVTGSRLRVSYVGHATVLVQTNGLNILTDPVWSSRASPVSWAGPKRVSDPGIVFADLPPIDVVLLSHNHYDHLDLQTLSRLKASHNPLIVAPLGNDRILKNHDPHFRVATGDWGDTIALSEETRVTLEPMHHWSARGLVDRRNALWAAFAVQTPHGNIYHVGDTGFHDGINYRAARKTYGGFRLAILPFGSYEPRGFHRKQHQNPDEAVQGHLISGAEFTIGHHWGTFQLTNESIDDQIGALRDARLKHGVDAAHFRALHPGEAWDVPERAPKAA